MNESTTLFLGPEENLNILRGIFSSRKTSAEDISKVTGKSGFLFSYLLTLSSSVYCIFCINLVFRHRATFF